MIILYKHPAGEINVVSEKSVIQEPVEVTTLKKRIQVLESNLARREVMKVDYT